LAWPNQATSALPAARGGAWDRSCSYDLYHGISASTARNLWQPSKEGEESVAFAGWRKSTRQIFKPLANVEGTRGFDDLLERVDHWLARGFGAKALRARDRASWRAALAELEIADHFEALEFVTCGLDEAKGQQRVGDMRVERIPTPHFAG
jgi:phosphoglycolate phosphatase-like HAD superfamily hydrolase